MRKNQGKPFTDTLGEVENGALLEDLTKKLQELTRAVIDTGKPGTIKVSLTLDRAGRRSVSIDGKIDVKIPEHTRPSSTFFLDEQGTLLRNDPNQPALPGLREVDLGDDRPLRQASD